MNPARRALAVLAAAVALVVPLLLAGAPTHATTAPATVGAPTCTGLTTSAGFTAAVPGQVIDGYTITGGIRVTAPNVTIRHTCLVAGSADYYGIYVAPGGSATISDTTISGHYLGAGLAGNNWSATRIEVNDVSNDATNMGNNTSLVDSYLHGFTPCAGCHSDGVQVFQLAGNITIRNNRIDVGTGNSAVILTVDVQQSPPVAGPVVLDGNTFAGGSYTVHVVPDFDAQITNNTWVRGAWQYGPIYPDPAPALFAGNVLSDGTALCWPGTTCSAPTSGPPPTSTSSSTVPPTTSPPPTTTTTSSPSPTTTTVPAPPPAVSLVCPVVAQPTAGRQITCTYQ